MLDIDGSRWSGHFDLGSHGWNIYELRSKIPELENAPYIVPLLPVDFHRHGIGGLDLSDLTHLDFETIDQSLADEQLAGILTIFLKRSELVAFCSLAGIFHEYKQRGNLPHIFGLALEGPLLSSPGGTPHECVWNPTMQEWKSLAACGELGLKYIVLSPDADPSPVISMQWIIELLLDAHVSPALGHFQKSDPEASAFAIRKVYDIAIRRTGSVRYTPLLSDHLFNDMPLLIRHAWRTADQKAQRQDQLTAMQVNDWQIENIRERLGPVPGELIRGAHEGLITLCLNFDGEHVDFEIARQTLKIAGADHIILLTDRVDGRKLASQSLLPSIDNRLLYRGDGIVVAGTTALDEQVSNLRKMRIPEDDIWKMIALNPYRALGLKSTVDLGGRPYRGSFVDSDQKRCLFAVNPGEITAFAANAE